MDKALDTHLKRPVAIKVLPPERVADPERRLRFVQEARAASALNHPNIVTIYDIDQSDGTDFIAMEYVAGKNLDRLIPRKGMRLGDTLKYAIQIADALAAAHAAGIVHRDLKPANVVVTDKGLVKVLDFGLAKLVESVESDEFRTTETLQPHTEEGTIVGTVAYMSPEQAEGRKVGSRSDIFSLGPVLYEMVTGRRAFGGDSRILTLSAILHQEPKPVSTIARATPADLEKLIERCLRKDPDQRIQHMDDVKLLLAELKEDLDWGRLQTTPGAVRRASPLRISAVVVAVAVLIAAGWYWLVRQGPTEPEAPLTAVPLTSYPGYEYSPSFSPDGTQVAFQWCTEGPEKSCDIYIKQIGFEPPHRPTRDPADDISPAWSPDGQLIAFLRRLSPTRQALMLIPQRGGQERRLGEFEWIDFEAPAPYLAWSTDSKWLVLPTGERGKEAMGLLLVSRETSEKKRLTTSPPGFFDTAPAFSPDGKRIAFCSDRSGSWEFWVCDSEGSNAVPLTSLAGEDDDSATWSPDGRRIAFGSVVGGKRHVFVANADGGPPRNLTTDPAGAMTFPFWSRDGQWIYFRSVRSGSSVICKIPATGGEAVQITPDGHERDQPQESPDGKFLYYVKGDRYPEQCSVWRMPTGGGEETRVIESTSCNGPFAFGKQGIHFLTPLDKQGRCSLSLYDFPAGNTRPILTFEQSLPVRIATSPDGWTILYTQTDQSGSDLMQVENFRSSVRPFRTTESLRNSAAGVWVASIRPRTPGSNAPSP